MLSCEQATAKLSAQIDGELSLRERAALWIHQFICSDCKVVAQNLRSLVRSMRDRAPAVLEEREAVQDDYVDRVMLALEQERADSLGDSVDPP